MTGLLEYLRFGLIFVAVATQTPKVTPRAGFDFLDEHRSGIFDVQRWVNASDPEVSPSGSCNCVTVVFLGARKVLTIDPKTVLSTEIDPRSGQDINGDNIPDLIVHQYTGGAHCCSSTTVYSVSTELKTILDAETGNCEGDFEDLDHDGALEFVTCDDSWAYAKCAFAFSPMPRVVYAYNATVGKYVLATPRFRQQFQETIAQSITQSEKDLADATRDQALDACSVLGPILDLMYVGRFDEGIAVFRRLYRQPDATRFEQEIITKARSSPLWVP
jgi:hypothetical protein